MIVCTAQSGRSSPRRARDGGVGGDGLHHNEGKDGCVEQFLHISWRTIGRVYLFQTQEIRQHPKYFEKDNLQVNVNLQINSTTNLKLTYRLSFSH